MTKAKTKGVNHPQPLDQLPDANLLNSQTLLDYRYLADGSLVVILASGQKKRFEPGQIPAALRNLQ